MSKILAKKDTGTGNPFDELSGIYNHEKNKVKFMREIADGLRSLSTRFAHSQYQNAIVLIYVMLIKKGRMFIKYNAWN